MRSLVYIITFCCLVSAVGVVWVRYENRDAVVYLQSVYGQRDNLNIEWRRLLLEHAAYSRYNQLENWATKNLNMKRPEYQTVLLLEKDGTGPIVMEVPR